MLGNSLELSDTAVILNQQRFRGGVRAKRESRYAMAVVLQVPDRDEFSDVSRADANTVVEDTDDSGVVFGEYENHAQD